MTKITIERATVEQALKALEVATTPLAKDRQEVLRAQAAIKEALAEPAQKQEPVDWEAVAADYAMTIAMMKAERKPWVGLTDDDFRAMGFLSRPRAYAAIEAKLKGKNT